MSLDRPRFRRQFTIRCLLLAMLIVAACLPYGPVERVVDYLRYTPEQRRIVETLRQVESVEPIEDEGPLISLPSPENWETLTKQSED